MEQSTGHPKGWGQLGPRADMARAWEPRSPQSWTVIVQMACPLTQEQRRGLPLAYRCGDHAPNYAWVTAATDGSAADAVDAALAAVLAVTGPETREQYCVSLTARRVLHEPAGVRPA